MQEFQKEYALRQREFFATERGRNFHFASRKYALNFAEDGTFRIEDVPGGKYTLRVELREPGESMNRFSARPIAFIQQEIEVPESPGGRADEPYDLGTLTMIPRSGLKPGKAMPEIAMRTLDDKPITIAGHKGKTLLLALWAPWNPANGSENAALKETYESFKNDERFAMVGVCLSVETAGPITDYISTNNLSWTQARLADIQQAHLFQQLGLNQMPAIYLVGPDGKLIATELRGPAIKKSVEEALSKHPNAQAAEAK